MHVSTCPLVIKKNPDEWNGLCVEFYGFIETETPDLRHCHYSKWQGL